MGCKKKVNTRGFRIQTEVDWYALICQQMLTLCLLHRFVKEPLKKAKDGLHPPCATCFYTWSESQAALTAVPVFSFGAFGQGYNLVVGKHSGLVSQLPAGGAQWLATSVTEVHHPCVLCERKKSINNATERQRGETLSVVSCCLKLHVVIFDSFD